MILAAPCFADSKDNLLLNPGAEQGKNEWPSIWFDQVRPADGLKIFRDEDHAHSGRFSLAIFNDHPYEERVCNNWAQNLQEIPTGKTIYLTAFIKAKNAESVNVCIQCWRSGMFSDMIAFASTPVIRGDQDWIQLKSTSITVPPETGKITVRAVLTGLGKAWFDDLTVCVGDEPSDMKRPSTLLNGDFEEGREGQVPENWISPTRSLGYEAEMTDENVLSGQYCAVVYRKSDEDPKIRDFGNIMQAFDAEPYRGKRVRFRGAVRIDITEQDSKAQLWMRVDREGRKQGFFDNMHDRPITSGSWKYYEIIGDIDQDAYTINIGMILIGKGRAWLDHVSFEDMGSSSRFADSSVIDQKIGQLDLLIKAQKYDEAMETGMEALAQARAHFGESHPSCAEILNLLGKCHFHQKNYDECEALFKQALSIREKAHGSDHPDLVKILNNLGLLYSRQMKKKEAESHLKRALQILENSPEPDQADLAECLHLLGELYSRNFKFEQAEPLLERALTIQEEIRGADHVQVVFAAMALAEVYREEGKFQEAEQLFKRAQAILEKALGPDHPVMIGVLHELAYCYEDQKKFAQAEDLYKRIESMSEKISGTDLPKEFGTHDLKMSGMDGRVSLYQTQGRSREAESLLKQELKEKEKTLGKEHPDVAKMLDRLARFYREQKRFEEAKAAFMRALDIREKALGPNDPQIAYNLNDLATICYHDLKKYTEAEAYYKRALDIGKKHLDSKRRSNLYKPSTLLSLYDRRGKHQEAESLIIEACNILKEKLGQDHTDLAWFYYQAGGYHSRRHRLEEAENYFLQAIAIFKKNEASPHYFGGMMNGLDALAGIYRRQSRDKELESINLQLIALSEKSDGSKSINSRSSLESLASLYRKQGEYDKAAAQYEKLLQITIDEFGPDHFRTAGIQIKLARFYNVLAKSEKIGPLAEQAEQILKKMIDQHTPSQPVDPYRIDGRYYDSSRPHPQDLLNPLMSLAKLYLEMGKPEEAEIRYDGVLDFQKKSFGGEHYILSGTQIEMAGFLYDAGKSEKAEALCEAARQIIEKEISKNPFNSSLASRLTDLGKFYSRTGRHQAIEPLSQRLQTLIKKDPSASPAKKAEALHRLVKFYKKTGRHAQADALMEYILEIKE